MGTLRQQLYSYYTESILLNQYVHRNDKLFVNYKLQFVDTLNYQLICVGTWTWDEISLLKLFVMRTNHREDL